MGLYKLKQHKNSTQEPRVQNFKILTESEIKIIYKYI